MNKEIAKVVGEHFYTASYWIEQTPVRGAPNVIVNYHLTEKLEGLEAYGCTLTKRWRHEGQKDWMKEVTICTHTQTLLYTEDDPENISWVWEEDTLDKECCQVISDHITHRFEVRYGK